MFLLAEAGTERWVQFARERASTLDALRRDLRLFAMSKAFVPEPGTLIWIKATEAGINVRITGGSFLRAWRALPLSVQTTQPGAVKQSRDFQPADWSADFKTFARYDGSSVVLRRGDEDEYVVPGSAKLPEFPRTPFFQNSTCCMSPSGKTAVTSVDTPSADSVAKVSSWDKDDGWSTTDVPFPPVDIEGVDWGGASVAASAELDSPATYWHTTRAVADNNPFNGAPRTLTANVAWGLFADPFHAGKVYVDVRMDSALVYDSFSVVGATLMFWRLDIVQQLWCYDAALGTWTLAAEHVDSDSDASAQTFISEHGDVTNGFSYLTGLVNSVRDLPHYEVMFGPDGPHLVSFDNRSLPQPTGLDHTFDGDGLLPQVVRTTATRLDAADVELDGTAWLSGVAVTATAGAAALAPQYVGTERRGHVYAGGATGAGAKGTVWAHGAGQLSPGLSTAIASKTARWLFYGAGHEHAYKDGEFVADIVESSASVMKSSWQRDGAVLVQYDGSASYHGQAGSVTVDGLGSFPVGDGAPPTTAFSLDGTQFFSSGSLFTEADLTAALGSPVHFFPNGVLVTVAAPGVPHLFTATVKPTGLSTSAEWPLTIDGAAYDAAQVIPDDFVIR